MDAQRLAAIEQRNTNGLGGTAGEVAELVAEVRRLQRAIALDATEERLVGIALEHMLAVVTERPVTVNMTVHMARMIAKNDERRSYEAIVRKWRAAYGNIEQALRAL